MVTAIDPTPAQAAAQNYKKGRVILHGLKIAIENARGTERKGTGSDGKAWSNLMANHYGHFVGFIGNDGDGVDVFIGAWPESKRVWIINQKNQDGSFDEHKVMLGFTSEEAARNGYLGSYSAGWQGLESIVACNVEQLAWWLKYGNKSKPVTPESLPDNGSSDMNKIFDSAVELAKLIYGIRKDDPESHALDAITMDEIMADSEGEPALDALVIEFVKVERKMGQMQAIMNAAGDSLQVSAVQVTPPFKQRGTTNVAGVFELSDGQTVSVFFHNPDVTPNRIAPQDELVSWKWMLNKKDITILVAPEKGDDLNAREVSRRIMKVAEKNSARFAKANADKANRVAAITGMQDDIAAKEQELAALEAEIAELETKKASSGTVLKGGKTEDAARELEFDELAPLGVATITDSGSENIYMTKDGMYFWSKVMNTEAYPVGEFDFAKYPMGLPNGGAASAGIKSKGYPFMSGATNSIYSADGKEILPKEWIGVAAGSKPGQFFYVGRDGNDRALVLLAATDYESAKTEAATFDEDVPFIQKVVGGKADLYDKAVTDKLAAMAGKYTAQGTWMYSMIKNAKTAAKNFFMAEFQKKTAA